MLMLYVEAVQFPKYIDQPVEIFFHFLFVILLLYIPHVFLNVSHWLETTYGGPFADALFSIPFGSHSNFFFWLLVSFFFALIFCSFHFIFLATAITFVLVLFRSTARIYTAPLMITSLSFYMHFNNKTDVYNQQQPSVCVRTRRHPSAISSSSWKTNNNSFGWLYWVDIEKEKKCHYNVMAKRMSRENALLLKFECNQF